MYDAYEKATRSDLTAQLAVLPCFDGELVIEENYRDFCKKPQLPLMAGYLKDDLFPSAMKRALKNYARKSNAAVYAYEFRRDLPGAHGGAWHSSDLWYFSVRLTVRTDLFRQKIMRCPTYWSTAYAISHGNLTLAETGRKPPDISEFSDKSRPFYRRVAQGGIRRRICRAVCRTDAVRRTTETGLPLNNPYAVAFRSALW